MVRRKIEIESGSIVPRVHGLWGAATEKLIEARSGAVLMKSAHDRIEFEGGWSRVVDSLEEFWTRFFDEGKIKFSSFQPWAGAIDSKRKKDELLLYLYQARHQSQHGRFALDWEEAHVQIAPGFGGYVRSVAIFPDLTFEMDAPRLHLSVPEATVVFSPGRARLPMIVNKKERQVFQPPQHHAGEPLVSTSPIDVACVALEYYEQVLKNAFEKFGAGK